MVTILLSSARIATGRLYVPALIATYPDIAPCRWNGKLSNPVSISSGNRLFIKTDITKTTPTTQPSNSRRGVADVKQPVLSSSVFELWDSGRLFKQWVTQSYFPCCITTKNRDWFPDGKNLIGNYRASNRLSCSSGGSVRAPRFLERLSQTLARHLCSGADTCDQRKRESALPHPEC